jgi:hypothetical protein
VLLGYDERGHCPLLVDGACSIYEHRPRACRTYDCRVFAATGVDLDDDGGDPAKAGIARRARRWAWREEPGDDGPGRALRAAARFLRERPHVLPDGVVLDPTRRAVLAVEIHEAFADPERTPTDHEVEVAIRRRPSAR